MNAMNRTPCVHCNKTFKNLAKHKKCSKKPIAPVVNQPIQIVEHPQESKLFDMIKSKLNYECKWTEEQINKTVNYLVHSLMMDHNQEQYPVKLDDLSDMLGYSQIHKAKELLFAQFQENIDYSLLTLEVKQKKKGKGGSNKQSYGLTISCAKRLCMLSKTKTSNDFRMYFIVIEDLFKECIRDPSLLGVVRDEIKLSLIDKLLVCKKELQFEQDFKDKNVIYFNQLLIKGETRKVYKYGITYRIDERPDEHRKRFDCDLKLVGVINVDHLTYKQSRDVETSIRWICKRIGIHYPYKGSNETFALDNEDELPELIDYIKNNLPACGDDNKISKEDHEYRMILAQSILIDKEIQLEKLRRGIVNIEIPEPLQVVDIHRQEGEPGDANLTQEQLHREWIEANHINVGESIHNPTIIV